MKLLADDSLLRSQLREQGLIRAEKFSWESTGQQTVQVIQDYL